jgi:hypothetical protein
MTVYRSALGEISDYLQEMEVPGAVADMMVATDSSDITWIDATDGLERPPSFAEWVDANCGHFTSEQEKELVKLEAKQAFGPSPNADETISLKELERIEVERSQCQVALAHAAVDRLSPP